MRSGLPLRAPLVVVCSEDAMTEQFSEMITTGIRQNIIGEVVLHDVFHVLLPLDHDDGIDTCQVWNLSSNHTFHYLCVQVPFSHRLAFSLSCARSKVRLISIHNDVVCIRAIYPGC